MKRTRTPGQESAMVRGCAAVVAVVAGAGIFAGTAGLGAQQAPASAATCAITGTIVGLGGPLPGVAITVRRGEAVQTATSTGPDGTFRVTLPDASYQLSADLTGFNRVQQDVVISRADSCAQQVNLEMALAPRSTAAATPSRGRGAGPAPTGAAAADETAQQAAGRRFETLDLQQNTATAGLEASLFGNAQDDPNALIPAGFGSEALADAFAVTGDAARVD